MKGSFKLVAGATPLQVLKTSLPGVFEIGPEVFRDKRGFFLESYQQARFAECGIQDKFVQDNHSCSVKGTLRGLHYQLGHPQAKLCRVIEGDALDVAVDIRLGSPTLGHWTSVVLSAHLANQLYIPAGFAHGFLALTKKVQFLYKCGDYYDPDDEYGIAWNDPELAISWGIRDPLLSEKDASYPAWAEVPVSHLPRYQDK